MAKGTHSDRLSAAQLRHLGLDKDPFSATPPDGTPFCDSALETQVNVVVHILQHSDQPVVVRGEEGVGKTAFLTLVRDAGGENLLMLDLSASANGDGDAVFRRIADAGGVDGEDETAASSALLRLRDMGQRPVLVLDDAERVPRTVLELLVGLRAELEARGASPGLILASASDLSTTLSRLDVETPLAEPHVVTLQPFDEAQTAAYIKSRLQGAGSLEGEQIPPSQCRQIHQRTHGNPAEINREAVRLLGALAVTSGGAPGGMGNRWLLPVGVGAVAVLVVGLLLANLLGGGSPEPDSQPAEVIDKPLKLPNRKTLENQPNTEQPTAPATAAGNGSPETAPGPSASQETESASASAPPSRTPSTPGTTTREATQPTDLSAKNPEPEAEPKPTERQLQGQKTAERTAKASQTTEGPTAGAEANQGGQRQERKPEASKTESAPPAHQPSHYTIQLIAAYDRASLNDFVAKHDLQGEAEIMETRRKGRPWYVVVYGDYSDRAAARDALSKLSEAMRRYGAWVRTYGSLSAASS